MRVRVHIYMSEAAYNVCIKTLSELFLVGHWLSCRTVATSTYSPVNSGLDCGVPVIHEW